MHAKSLTLDGEVTLIGSANMDRRSFELNYENNILFYDPALTADMRRRQDVYLAQSRPVTAEIGGALAHDVPVVEQRHRNARAGAVSRRDLRSSRPSRSIADIGPRPDIRRWSGAPLAFFF